MPPPKSSFAEVLLTGLMLVAVTCAVIVTVSVIRRDTDRKSSARTTSEMTSDGWAELKTRGNRIGNPRAPVQVVEFTDFECTFCKQFHSDYWPRLASKYGENLSLVVRQYPLSIHPYAYRAAKAVECAGTLGRFEEMFVALGQLSEPLNDSVMAEIQTSVGVDKDPRFADCWTAEPNPSVEADQKLARAMNVTGTPTLVVNGTRLVGLPSYSALDSIIAAKLSETGQ